MFPTLKLDPAPCWGRVLSRICGVARGAKTVKENAMTAFNIWSIVYGAALIAGLIVVVGRGL